MKNKEINSTPGETLVCWGGKMKSDWYDLQYDSLGQDAELDRNWKLTVMECEDCGEMFEGTVDSICVWCGMKLCPECWLLHMCKGKS